MAHHGNDEFKNVDLSKAFKEIPFRELMDAKQNEIGATGKFPEGHLNKDDEGEIKFRATITDNKLVVDFGKPVHWVGLTKQQAIDFSEYLASKAEEME